MIEVHRADSPLVLGFPHTGTDLLGIEGLNERGHAMADTDWHVHNLYEGLAEATTVRTTVHRYVIDVNRSPRDESLYPGQNTTGLCPLTDFDGLAIYEGSGPDPVEVARRAELAHRPYHEGLRAEMERVRGLHGFAILFDCHSIRSTIPFLFDGRLPDLNIGTNGGRTCAPEVERLVTAACADAPEYNHVLNGRFKGGWTTRHYGRPVEGWHAIQMELAQSTYMLETPPWSYDVTRADPLRALLRRILTSLTQWRP